MELWVETKLSQTVQSAGSILGEAEKREAGFLEVLRDRNTWLSLLFPQRKGVGQYGGCLSEAREHDYSWNAEFVPAAHRDQHG